MFGQAMFQRILIAIDNSEVAERALVQGVALARALGSAVTIVHVANPVPPQGAYGTVTTGSLSPASVINHAKLSDARELIDEARATAKALGVDAATLWIENSGPAAGILETAEIVGADLVVMGTNGRRGLSRMMLGSQASSVLQHAKVPVFVTK